MCLHAVAETRPRDSMPKPASMLLCSLVHWADQCVCGRVIPGTVLTGPLPVQAVDAVPKELLGSSVHVLHTHPISLMRWSLNTVVYYILNFLHV